MKRRTKKDKMVKQIGVCALEDSWIDSLTDRLHDKRLLVQMTDDAETLWDIDTSYAAIVIQEEELTEVYRWREREQVSSSDAAESETEYRAMCVRAYQDFKRMKAVPVIVVLKRKDDALEESLLQAGAAECVHQEQTASLAACRIFRAVSKYVVAEQLVVGWNSAIVNHEERKFQIDGRSIHLSKEECITLDRLLQAEGAVVSRTDLAKLLWKEPVEERHRLLDSIMKRIRQRLAGTGFQVSAKYGKGYYLQYFSDSTAPDCAEQVDNQTAEHD